MNKEALSILEKLCQRGRGPAELESRLWGDRVGHDLRPLTDGEHGGWRPRALSLTLPGSDILALWPHLTLPFHSPLPTAGTASASAAPLPPSPPPLPSTCQNYTFKGS